MHMDVRVVWGKDGRVDLGLATDWYSVFLILDPIWRFVVVIQASVDRDCPTCLQRHLSNIL